MGGKNNEQTVGYRYFLGLHLIPCLGPVDRLLRLDVDDRTAWAGNSPGGRLYVNAPGLFGGDKREGGVSGYIDVANGGPTQAANDYLSARWGATETPAFRGVLGLVFRQFYLGNNPYLKPWAVKVQRVFTTDDGAEQWQPSLAGVARPPIYFDSAVYITADVSGSMTGTQLSFQRNSIVALLEFMRDNTPASQPNDVQVLFYASGVAATLRRRNCSTADYNDLISFVQGAGGSGGTDFGAAFSQAQSFFWGDGASADPLGAASPYGDVGSVVASIGGSGTKRRMIFHLSDGGADPAPAVAIRDSILGVECFAISIDTAVASSMTAIDNTPQDGVPVVNSANPDAMIDAFTFAFSGGYDMNPAHILREVLISRDTGGSGDDSEIGPSFATAAQTLFDEQFGLSFYWRNSGDRRSFIEAIERHVDGRLYQDRRTGLWEFALVRPDYEVATLPVFNRTNVVEWGDPIRPDPSRLPNQVTLTYTDPDKDEPATITLTNIARVAQAGQIRNESLEYEGLYRRELASRIAYRELAALSAPLLSGEFRARYVDPSVNLGSPIVIHNPNLGIDNVVCRVVEMEDGDGRSNDVWIKYVEDKFGVEVDDLVAVEEPEGGGILNDPAPATARMVEEMPYWQLVAAITQFDADQRLAADPDLGLMHATADSPTDDAIAATLSRNIGNGDEDVGTVQFSPSSILRSNLRDRADEVFALVDTRPDLSSVAIGSLAWVGGEMMRVDAIEFGIDPAPGDYWEPPVSPPGGVARITFGRGCLDTAPRYHDAGAAILFWQGFAAGDGTQYLAGEVVPFKLLTQTGLGVLSPDVAPADDVTFDSRAIRPYPPGNVRVNGEFATFVWGPAVTLTWADRDRTLQTTATIEDHADGDIGPEPGTAYRVRLYAVDQTGAQLGADLIDVNVGTAKTYAIDPAPAAPAGAFGMIVEVLSIRDGYESRWHRRLEFEVVVDPTDLVEASWLDVNQTASLWRDATESLPVEYDLDPIGTVENQRGQI